MTDDEKRRTHREVYNQIAYKYNDEFGEYWEDITDIIKFRMSLKPNAKVLDLGSGPGHITNYLSEKGLDVIGIDYSEKMIEYAKNKYPNTKFENMDIYDIAKNFDSNTFDGIHAAYSLMSIPKSQMNYVLESIKKILKPDGNIFLIMQRGEGEKFLDEPFLEKNNKALFYNFYDEKELLDKLQEFDFKITHFNSKNVSDPGDPASDAMLFVFAKNIKVNKKETGKCR